MDLEVEVKLSPHPQEVSPEIFDRMLDGELAGFERWFIKRQRDRGNPSPTGLISAERAIVKAYVLYLATKEP